MPRHIFHYTADSLHAIITEAGLEGEIRQNEMPLMGNMLAIFFPIKKESRLAQVLGILLHPAQLAVGLASSAATCLNVSARRPGAGAANR